jgi:hypothetical protein
MFKTRDYIYLIEELFSKYDLNSDCYEIVPSIKEWCDLNGIVESNLHRAAKCLCRSTDGKYHILFAENQTDLMIESGKDYMKFIGLSDCVASLSSDESYFRHLVLHEIACPVLGNTDQKVRDTWAFREMGIIPH